jgi:hypothetical protein
MLNAKRGEGKERSTVIGPLFHKEFSQMRAIVRNSTIKRKVDRSNLGKLRREGSH